MYAQLISTYTARAHTHTCLTALCPGLPGWAGTRKETEARGSEWQWHQLGHIQVCTGFQTDNHASTPTAQFFTGRMPFLPPNQQRQSTEGTTYTNTACIAKLIENSEILRVQEPRYVKVPAATISTKDIQVFCSLATAGTVDKCRIKIVGYDLRVIAVGVVGVVTILGQHGRVFLKICKSLSVFVERPHTTVSVAALHPSLQC